MVAPVVRPTSAERALPRRAAEQPVVAAVVVRVAAGVAAEDKRPYSLDLKVKKPSGGRLIQASRLG